MTLPVDDRVFIHQIDGADIITGFNASWRAFAEENGIPDVPDRVIGLPLWRFIADNQVSQLYRDLLTRARRDGRPIRIAYRCDSPEMRRFMEMVITPLGGAAVEFSSRVLRMEPRSPADLPEPAPDLPPEETLIMCSWCKRVAVPEWVEIEEAAQRLSLFHRPRPFQISHGACPACAARLLAK